MPVFHLTQANVVIPPSAEVMPSHPTDTIEVEVRDDDIKMEPPPPSGSFGGQTSLGFTGALDPSRQGIVVASTGSDPIRNRDVMKMLG